MTLSIDDLVATFNNAFDLEYSRQLKDGEQFREMDCDRAAMVAAVGTLQKHFSGDWLDSELFDAFNEILARGDEAAGTDTAATEVKPEAIERSAPTAAPVCFTCKGAGLLFGPYDPDDCEPCPDCTPAAAPDACKWRAGMFEGAYTPGCDTPNVWYSDGSNTPKDEGYNFCPSCGKPIMFVEAAR